MSDAYVGEIRLFGFDYAPQDWLLCNGQILSITAYPMLYSLLGITYGGNGTTTFALPNFNGRAPAGQGAGPGLTPRVMGESFGVEAVSLLSSQMPSHNHTFTGYLQGNTAYRSAQPAAGNHLSNSTKAASFAPPPGGNILYPMTAGVVGANQAHENRQPYLTMNFCIATTGVYPNFD